MADEQVNESNVQPSDEIASGCPCAPKNPWAALLIGLVIVFGAGAYYMWIHSPAPSIKATFMCVTDGCDYVQTRALKADETLPAKCPKCGKQSVYSTFKCPKCGTPNVMNEDRGLPAPTKCTKCGMEIDHGD